MSNAFYSLAPTAFQVLKAGEKNPKKKKRIIYGQATSDANGVATLYLTDNGAANGNALLTTIDYAVASVYSTNTNISDRPRVQMREKNVIGKYISANVTKMTSVTLLGLNVLGSETAVNGVSVDFMAIGDFNN